MFDDSKAVCKGVRALGAKAVRCDGGVSVARLMEGLEADSEPGWGKRPRLGPAWAC